MDTLEARSIRALPQAIYVFARQPSPRILAAMVIVLVRARVHMLAFADGPLGFAGLSVWDVVLAAAILLVLWPVQEWVLHRYVLHLRPFELFGRTIDPFFARKHRSHHAQPDYVPDIFLPARVVLPLVPVSIGFWWLIMPTPSLAFTAMISYAVAALAYEWIHYFTHTSVAPKTAWMRRIRRNHRYHHYKNENYWYAFVIPQVDTLFGTDPKVTEVETSPTARNLGVEG